MRGEQEKWQRRKCSRWRKNYGTCNPRS